MTKSEKAKEVIKHKDLLLGRIWLGSKIMKIDEEFVHFKDGGKVNTASATTILNSVKNRKNIPRALINGEYYGIGELSSKLGVSRQTIYNHINKGKTLQETVDMLYS